VGFDGDHAPRGPDDAGGEPRVEAAVRAEVEEHVSRAEALPDHRLLAPLVQVRREQQHPVDVVGGSAREPREGVGQPVRTGHAREAPRQRS
jgi:hypothetical protein